MTLLIGCGADICEELANQKLSSVPPHTLSPSSTAVCLPLNMSKGVHGVEGFMGDKDSL